MHLLLFYEISKVRTAVLPYPILNVITTHEYTILRFSDRNAWNHVLKSLISR